MNDNLSSRRLDDFFTHFWKDTESKEHYPLVGLKIKRKSASLAVFEFIRQDHIAFWDHKFNGSQQSLPAILITDSGRVGLINEILNR